MMATKASLLHELEQRPHLVYLPASRSGEPGGGERAVDHLPCRPIGRQIDAWFHDGVGKRNPRAVGKRTVRATHQAKRHAAKRDHSHRSRQIRRSPANGDVDFAFAKRLVSGPAGALKDADLDLRMLAMKPTE